MALRRKPKRTEQEGSEGENQTVKVVLGYDVANPLIGEATSEDTFETLLNKVAEQGDFNPSEVRNAGYTPIVSGRAYSFSDNVNKALNETNSKEITFMTKQKGGK